MAGAACAARGIGLRNHGIIHLLPVLLLVIVIGIVGCSASDGSDSATTGEGTSADAETGLVNAGSGGTSPAVTAADEAVPTDSSGNPIDTSRTGTRDHTPRVLQPDAPGLTTCGNEHVTIDTSNIGDGYVEIDYHGDSSKVKIQITPPNGNTYTYDVKDFTPGGYETFPLTCGDGEYKVGIYTNVQDNMYATEYETDLSVQLADAFSPFLYPNQLVWFTASTKAVAAAEEAATPADTDLDAVSLIYDYVIHHMTYDWEKARTVKSGYIPDVDAVLASGKGICFDYSSLLTAMLRSQRIPTRMEIGYAGTAYHAWVSTYLDETGWVNGIIRFDGTSWELMDPTLATTKTEKQYKDFIQTGSNYRAIYLY